MKEYKLRPKPENRSTELRAYPELIQHILLSRGMDTASAAQAFLEPSYERDMHDPYLLRDMDVAVVRLQKALTKQERIVIFSDYDMDGIPGAVVLFDVLTKIGIEKITHYTPHRNIEGFGLNIKAVEKLADEGVTLIITVDCGISDVAPIARANALGIDVIVTDHHLPGIELPAAYAIINPKQEGCSYPFKELCGAGVAFKLGQALLQKFPDVAPKGYEKWLLDMVGMATIADMVPLIGENRVFAYYGLIVLRKSRRPGIRELCRKLRIDQRYLSEDDIGFMIAPRINAASRMGVASDAFALLKTHDDVEARTLAGHLDRINNERKGVVASMAKEIKSRIEKLGEVRDVIVMGNPDWKPSLLGLAANALVEEYKRPVFLWGREEGIVIKGSCRSDGSVSVHEVMSYAKGSFLEFGGHVFSGGFSLDQEKVHTLEQTLLDAYEKAKQEAHTPEPLYIDRVLSLIDVSYETNKVLETLAPFGVGNPKPLFLFSPVILTQIKQFGKEGAHCELVFTQDGYSASAITFYASSDICNLPVDMSYDLIATIEKSTYGGRVRMRLRLVDVLPVGSVGV